MLNIIAQADHIIFRFNEDIQSGRFVNSTSSGILVSSVDVNQSNLPRWAIACYVGPEVKDVRVGDFVLIEPGKWTNGFYVDDIRYWKTDEANIMAISDTAEATY